MLNKLIHTKHFLNVVKLINELNECYSAKNY